MNAIYGEYHVTVFHNGQHRTAILCVVQLQNGKNKYFLRDFYGWAIDDCRIVEKAVAQFTNGTARQIEITD